MADTADRPNRDEEQEADERTDTGRPEGTPLGTSTAGSGERKTGESYEERDDAEGGRA